MATRKAAVKTEQKSEIVEAIKFLAKEKELSEEMLFATVEDALRKAYTKNLPKDMPVPSTDNITATIGRTDGVVRVYLRRMVVETGDWFDELPGAGDRIPMDEAQKLVPNCQLGDIIETEVTPNGFLRVAAQTAKGVIMQRLRDAERGRIYDEYIDKENEILTAIVRRVDQKGVFLELGRTEGVLDNSEMIPGEVLKEDDHVKVYVLEVHRAGTAGPRGPQVRVSRIHPKLVQRLFEMEVPEIAGGAVIIKGIAREAGSRTKMAVYAADMMVDPVGSCVGQRGSRVDRVVNELKGEKIDIIKWSDNPAEFIANALNPAHVLSVFVEESGQKSCKVVVPDNQLSLAIGKEGQNARLAAKLTGWKIDIKSESQANMMSDMVEGEQPMDFEMPMADLDAGFAMPEDDIL